MGSPRPPGLSLYNAPAEAIAETTVAATPETSGLFEPTWWQSGLILLAWVVVAYAIGAIVVRRSDVK